METIIALILCVAIFGLATTGVLMFLGWRKIQSRIEIITKFLDSLDERTLHQHNLTEIKLEDFRSKIESQKRHQGEEKEQLDYTVSELREVWNGKMAELKDELQSIHQAIQDHLSTQLTEQANNLKKLESQQNDQSQSLETLREQLDLIQNRNDLILGYAQFSSDCFDKSLTNLQPLLENNPGDPDVVLLTVKCLEESDHWNEALDILKRAVETSPEQCDFYEEMAFIERRRGNHQLHREILEEGLKHDANHTGLRYEWSFVEFNDGQYEKALESLTTLLSDGIENAALHYNLGTILMHLNRNSEAVQHFRRSLALDPMSADSNHALGLALIDAERYLEAVDFLERSRELLPNVVSIRLDLAAAYRLNGDYDRAQMECAVAQSLNSSIPRVYLERGLAYFSAAKFNETLEVTEQLLEIEPDNEMALRLQAKTYLEIEQYEQAVEAWNRVAVQNPRDAEVQVALAMALKGAGRNSVALGCLEIATRMAPELAWIKILLAREALALNRFEIVQEIIDEWSVEDNTAQEQLQMIQVWLLLALVTRKWFQMENILQALKDVLASNPEILPLDSSVELCEEAVLGLNLDDEAVKIHKTLLDVYEGSLDFGDLDEQVTRSMRSLLPTPGRPPAPPTTVEKTEPVVAAKSAEKKPEPAPLPDQSTEPVVKDSEPEPVEPPAPLPDAPTLEEQDAQADTEQLNLFLAESQQPKEAAPVKAEEEASPPPPPDDASPEQPDISPTRVEDTAENAPVQVVDPPEPTDDEDNEVPTPQEESEVEPEAKAAKPTRAKSSKSGSTRKRSPRKKSKPKE